MIKLNNKVREFCKLQRTVSNEKIYSDDQYDILYNEGINRDIDEIKPFILNKKKLNICDIGCGVGSIDILLYKNFDVNHLTLIDKNGISNIIYYGFKNDASFYNDIILTKTLLSENGVPLNVISMVDVNKDTLPFNENYDIIISLLSLSFHYPYLTYSKFIKKTLKSEGILILDVRNNTTEISNILDDFKKCEIIKQKEKSKRIIFYR